MATVDKSQVKKLDDSLKFYGICTNCLQNMDCAPRQNPDKPILFCEQFEVFASPPEKLEVKRDDVKSKEYDNNFLGLCKNCDDRVDCMYPKPESGIWHCEAYQ